MKPYLWCGLLLISGGSLLTPLLYLLFLRPPAFGSKAFTPVFTISLQEITKSGNLTKEIQLPSEEEVGAYDLAKSFVILGSNTPGIAYCWDQLKVDLSLTAGEDSVRLSEAVQVPYMWTAPCPQFGVKFYRPQNRLVKINVRASSSSGSPNVDLVVIPYWERGAKDRLAGMHLDRRIEELSGITTPLGLLLLSSILLASRRAEIGRR